MSSYTEDSLVQQTTADYLRDSLGWESVYAFDKEDYGTKSLLGRGSQREVVLTRYLRQKLVEFNPGLPDLAYDDAIRQIVEVSASQNLITANQEKYNLHKNGVKVSFLNNKGELVKQTLRLFDFDHPENNHFLAVRELWVQGDIYRRRIDIAGFVNGIPLLFVECKNVYKDLETAYNKNFSDYKDTISQFFYHNAIIMLANGTAAKIGSVTGKYEHFNEWKRLSEDEPGVVDMETLLKGVCNKSNFMDIFENFITFNDSTGTLIKVLARNHQYLGVNRALKAIKNRDKNAGKLGVFWHTQGSGKSFSMVFLTQKVHRKLGGNFTFLMLTDRLDLDTQLYKTFVGSRLVGEKDNCRTESGQELQKLLGERKAFIFSLIQKFNQKVITPYTVRNDIIVITDEAHRSQYGMLALNMRDALPNASFLGFTGTPLFKEDEITSRVFGSYVSTYDFKRAVEDNATVPLYYDARGEKLGLSTVDINERLAEKLEKLEFEDIDVAQRLEGELKREYHIITAEKRLSQIADDFVEHYSNSWESGKAMFVCIDKLTTVKMLQLVQERWEKKINDLEQTPQYASADVVEENKDILEAKIAWMKSTEMAAIFSEEQGEVDKFRKAGLDVIPHRRLMKQGFETPDGKRIDVETAFKKDDHPFRVSFVCAMWLTGFDVPSLANMYLDKPLKAHTLMQAIARANRVHEGKNNGLILDYCGILKNLRDALATFAGTSDSGHGEGIKPTDPTKPAEELLEELSEILELIKSFLAKNKVSLESIHEAHGFEKNKALLEIKEAININDESRKLFEIMCRQFFKKFKACINLPEIYDFRDDYYAINTIYKSLQDDREKADISDIIRELHAIVDESVVTDQVKDKIVEKKPYDISQIDFDRLRQEFTKSKKQNTQVQSLKYCIDQKLAMMIDKNPLRIDFQKHYQEIIDKYNHEKNAQVIEETFEELFRFIQSLDQEEHRALRENLNEESLAMYDLLVKDGLTKEETKQLKKVAVNLLENIKAEIENIHYWRDRENSRDAIKQKIHDYLWSDSTGITLPEYSEKEINKLSDAVYYHVYRAYPKVPSPIYGESQYAYTPQLTTNYS